MTRALKIKSEQSSSSTAKESQPNFLGFKWSQTGVRTDGSIILPGAFSEVIDLEDGAVIKVVQYFLSEVIRSENKDTQVQIGFEKLGKTLKIGRGSGQKAVQEAVEANYLIKVQSGYSIYSSIYTVNWQLEPERPTPTDDGSSSDLRMAIKRMTSELNISEGVDFSLFFFACDDSTIESSTININSTNNLINRNLIESTGQPQLSSSEKEQTTNQTSNQPAIKLIDEANPAAVAFVARDSSSNNTTLSGLSKATDSHKRKPRATDSQQELTSSISISSKLNSNEFQAAQHTTAIANTASGISASNKTLQQGQQAKASAVTPRWQPPVANCSSSFSFARSSGVAMPRKHLPAYLYNLTSAFNTVLGDTAHASSNFTQVANLFERSGLSVDEFADLMYASRALTLQFAKLRPGEQLPPQGQRRNVMPYFFTVLRKRLFADSGVEASDYVSASSGARGSSSQFAYAEADGNSRASASSTMSQEYPANAPIPTKKPANQPQPRQPKPQLPLAATALASSRPASSEYRQPDLSEMPASWLRFANAASPN